MGEKERRKGVRKGRKGVRFILKKRGQIYFETMNIS
jgi:hypothetical protein